MTLTEFLLARIAEDEVVARRAQKHYQHVFGIPHYFTANSDTSVAMNPRVALAECEAKRRIVKIVGGLGGYYEPNAGRIAPEILRWLALPYADHPDYREDWKP